MNLKIPPLSPKKLQEEMYRRNLELAETNHTLSLLRKIDEFVLESDTTLAEISLRIAEALVGAKGAPFAGLLATPTTKRHLLRFYGYGRDPMLSEDDKQFFQGVNIDLEKNQWLSKSTESHLFDLASAGSTDEVHHLMGLSIPDVGRLKRISDSRYIYVTKLTVREVVTGVLLLGFGKTAEEPDQETKEFFDRLSESIGVAVDSKLLVEENKRIVAKLRRTNEKLKELDETKDEFISMASHQLRTPLTSVKGYTSMVLDGDAGKLNVEQKKLLNQAFVSSQRMVYLIADLLNVSRLKTGKFVIDATPTNLAEVVDGEIEQLKTVAKGKDITLTYTKPKEFPDLMLDETKIRQVIMNFVDNAIHYTPNKGKVEVVLRQDKNNVYFSVKDNGIGVPKQEKEHLFTKFYRAKNAVNARPDGTGLGLFMAKKVVDAQGGSIIFDTKEGSGSTFGFTFSKKKHAIPTK